MDGSVREAWLALAGTRVKEGLGMLVEPLGELSLSSDSSDVALFFCNLISRGAHGAQEKIFSIHDSSAKELFFYLKKHY